MQQASSIQGNIFNHTADLLEIMVTYLCPVVKPYIQGSKQILFFGGGGGERDRERERHGEQADIVGGAN